MHLTRRSVGALAAAASAAILVAAVVAVESPPGIAGSGRIVFCSDLGYPPMESLQGAHPVGADIDIGTALAKQRCIPSGSLPLVHV